MDGDPGPEGVPDVVRALVPAVVSAVRGGRREELEGFVESLRSVDESRPEDRAAVATLRLVIEEAGREGSSGLAPQAGGLEPGSLPARLLVEIAAGVRVANQELAERLGTDPWQLSRAGRRLREAGLAERERQGRINVWEVTDAGREEVDRIRVAVRR